MRGGIFLRKMTLGVYVSVKSRIETALLDLQHQAFQVFGLGQIQYYWMVE
jgi:hypothetical protein